MTVTLTCNLFRTLGRSPVILKTASCSVPVGEQQWLRCFSISSNRFFDALKQMIVAKVSGPGVQTVNVEDVKNGLAKSSILLIDVRSESERADPGRIPGSLHVPLKAVANAFGPLPPEEFKAEYHFKKPSKAGRDERIVFSCFSGVRASKAAGIVSELGYLNLAVYAGSFQDWKSQGYNILSGDGTKSVVDFEQVKDALEDKSMIVIDVRKIPSERMDPGAMPGTHNVPLPEIWTAFAEMSPGDFQKKYGFPRPGPEVSSNIVISCGKGKWARIAADKLALLGYKETKVYKGSFTEWKEKGGAIIQPN